MVLCLLLNTSVITDTWPCLRQTRLLREGRALKHFIIVLVLVLFHHKLVVRSALGSSQGYLKNELL